MKLFLASSISLSVTQVNELLLLVGKEKANKALIITAAVVPYGLDPRPEWVDRSLEPIKAICNEVVETTLEDGDFIPENLQEYDLVFVTGGNTFYLAYRLQETGWDQKLKEYIAQGRVYAGSSAGSVILMDDIQHFASADDSTKAPMICGGLAVLYGALVCHADHEKYAPIMADIATKYEKDGLRVIKLNDDQVLIVDGETERII